MAPLRLAVTAASSAEPPHPPPDPKQWGAGYDFSGLLPLHLVCRVSIQPIFFFFSILSDSVSADLSKSTQQLKLFFCCRHFVRALCSCMRLRGVFVCVFNILLSCASVSHMLGWRVWAYQLGDLLLLSVTR